MIPKKIHYFWFSGEVIPKKLQKCLDSWEKSLQGYSIQKWDLSNSPIECPFAQRAIAEKKWAFLTDYCRFKVLFAEGGIYLDSDVFVVKDFNALLHYDSFWSSTDFGKVDPFIFGSKKANPIVANCIDFYENIDMNFSEFPIVPDVIGSIFHKIGHKGENDAEFVFDNNIILPFTVFCPMPFNKADDQDFMKYSTKDTIAIHLWNTGWNDPFRFFYQNRRKSGWKAVRKEIKKNPFQPLKFYKDILYHVKCGLLGYPKK